MYSPLWLSREEFEKTCNETSVDEVCGLCWLGKSIPLVKYQCLPTYQFSAKIQK